MRGTTTVDDERGKAGCTTGSDRVERLIAQIVRDFLQGYQASRRLGLELRAGTLTFETVNRFVADSPQSVLFRLKEDCHSLFRGRSPAPEGELRAEELFDLAIGALFHEAMKFRESYYLYTAYGPRARRSLEASSATPLAQGFRRLFEAGYRRMLESEAETAELFRETRAQLRVLLREWSHAGEIARVLVADPAETETVFGVPLQELLDDLFGSVERGYSLSIQTLVRSGHYDAAAGLLDRPEVGRAELEGVEPDLVRGLAAYYDGDPCGALRILSRWSQGGDNSLEALRSRARAVARLIAYEVEESHPALAREARRLEERLGGSNPPRSS